MTKFPLESRPFNRVWLSDNEIDDYKSSVESIVTELLNEFETHIHVDNYTVDSNRWRYIKKHENMSIFHERMTQSSSSNRLHSANMDKYQHRDPSDADFLPIPVSSRPMQNLLACGTIVGDLNDLMYGVVNSTRENMMLKASYIRDNVVDCAVLATLVESTPVDPMRSLVLKWSVNGCPPLVRGLIRPRDFVYLEATGYAYAADGERIGYHIIRSLELPGVRHLHEFNLVRGNLRIYHLFRQRSPNIVDVYLRGFCDTMGDMHPVVATYSCAEAMLAIGRSLKCSHMKKLTWLLKNNATACTASGYSPGACCVCHKSVRSLLHPPRRCRVCLGVVCNKCIRQNRLSFLSPVNRDVISKKLSFCTRCVREANTTNGYDIAVDELRRENRYEVFEVGTIRSSNDSHATFFFGDRNPAIY